MSSVLPLSGLPTHHPQCLETCTAIRIDVTTVVIRHINSTYYYYQEFVCSMMMYSIFNVHNYIMEQFNKLGHGFYQIIYLRI